MNTQNPKKGGGTAGLDNTHCRQPIKRFAFNGKAKWQKCLCSTRTMTRFTAHLLLTCDLSLDKIRYDKNKYKV